MLVWLGLGVFAGASPAAAQLYWVDGQPASGLTRSAGVAVDSGGTPAPPVNTAPPELGGATGLGDTLACSTGTWTGDGPLSYTFRWLRDGSAISGATASSYRLTNADAWHTLRCEVTASGPGGSATQASRGVFIIPLEGVPTPPASVVAPSLTGTIVAGKVVTCSKGVWIGTAPISFSYKWLLDRVAIAGATAASYQTSTSQASHLLACQVTAHNSAGSATATSCQARLFDRTAPRLTNVSVDPKTSKRGNWATLRYSVSEPGTLRVSAETYNARERRYLPVKGSITLRARRAGSGSFHFKTRLGSIALTTGRYRLLITPRDQAGNPGRAARATFTIRS